MGAYPIGAYLPVTTQEMLAGVYRFPAIACRGRSVVTNATPVAPYRGAGRPEATALVERAMDMLAAELGMDPVEVRRRNLIPPDAFPFTTASGTTYDVGAYEAALDEALRVVGLRGAARRAGRAPCARRSPDAGDRPVHLRRDHVVLLEGVRLGRRWTPTASVTVLTGHVAARAGPRDRVRADRVLGDGRPAWSPCAVDPLRHGPRAARRRHVGVAVAAGGWLRRLRARRGREREGADRSRPICWRWTPGTWRRCRRADRGARRARALRHVGGARRGRGRRRPAARGHGAGPGVRGDVPRARFDVPVRHPRRRRGGGHADGRGRG